MNTPQPHNKPIDRYNLHLDPRPGFVLFCTMLAIALLSIFLHNIALKASIFDYSLASAYNEHSQMKNMTTYQSGVTQDWAILDGQILIEEGETGGNCAVSRRFPPAVLQWCDLITRYANKRGLPPDLVAALIWQESGGDPLAYSYSGAVGLMQVMPRDGIAASFVCANGPCFSSRPTTQELQDPEYNIAYGTRLLVGLFGRHGDLREALKFYGPRDVGYYYADKVFGLFHRYGEHSS